MIERQMVRFPNADGLQLSGRLETPADPRAYVVFAHCFACTKDLKSAGWISRRLAEHGLATLRFDFAGVGDSAGQFPETNFTTNVNDIIAAAQFLRKNNRPPQLLIGHSLGGSASIAAAAHIDSIQGVVTIASPFEIRAIADRLEGQAPALRTAGRATLDLLGRQVTISHEMLNDFRTHDGAELASRLQRPLLVLHSPRDEVVPVAQGEQLFAAARQPKSFVALDGMDHLMVAREDDARYVADLIATWFDRLAPRQGKSSS